MAHTAAICKPCRAVSAVSTLYPRRSSSAFWYPSMPPSSSMQRMVLCSGKSDLMGTFHITMIDDVGGHGCSKLHTFRGNVVQVDLGQYGFLRFWAGISRPPG